MRVLVLALILGLVAIPASQAQGANCNTTPTSLSDPITRGVWDEIMRRRQANGYTAYQWSDQLALSAAWMARDRAQRLTTSTTDIDSLGRNARARATDCGYRTDASVAETAGRMWTTNPFSVYLLWNGGDAIRMYWAIRSGAPPPDTSVYQVAALGRYRDAVSGADFWVMNMGAESSVPAPTATPTATPTPTPTSTPTPIPDPNTDRVCVVDREIVPGESFVLSCSS